MKLPFKLIPFNKWIAFKAPLPKNEHRIIILKIQQSDIKYLYVTSEVDNCKRVARYDKGCIAEIKKEEWDSLTQDVSCIQCDKRHIYSIDIEKLKKFYNDDMLEYIGEIPDILKTRIISSICASETFTDKEKQYYTL